jgi:hypothetical protein
MAWDDGGTKAASTAAHNNQIVNGGGGRGIGDGAQQSQNSEWQRGGESKMEEDKAKLKHGNSMVTMPKTSPSSHKDLAPIPLRGWIFLCGSYAFTYLPEHYM